MKKAHRMAAVLGFVLASTSAIAAADKADITGAWIVTLDLAGTKATIEANIKQNDDKLSAEVVTPAGTFDFNGTLLDNKISAVYLLRVHGNVLEVRMNGVVDADTLSGTIAFGPSQEMRWTAVRKPTDVVPDVPVTEPAQDSTIETAPDAPK